MLEILSPDLLEGSVVLSLSEDESYESSGWPLALFSWKLLRVLNSS